MVSCCYIERKKRVKIISFFFDVQLPPLCFSSFSGRSKSKENEWTRAFLGSRSLDPNFKRNACSKRQKKREEKNPFVKTRRRKTENVPMVGIVVTISPSLSLYKMVVLPAASRPTCACVPRLE